MIDTDFLYDIEEEEDYDYDADEQIEYGDYNVNEGLQKVEQLKEQRVSEEDKTTVTEDLNEPEELKVDIETGEVKEVASSVSEDSIVFDVDDDVIVDKADTSNDLTVITKKDVNLEYPLLFLEASDIPKYKITALQSMLVTTSYELFNTQMYNVYLSCMGNILKIGTTTNYALKAIFTSEVFNNFKKYVKLDENTKIEGNLLFALCGVKV